MKQINIYNNSILTNQATFPTMEEAQAWYDSHNASNSFGPAQSSHTIQVEVSPAVYESQEILDNGVSFDPPQFQEVLITPAVFEDQVVNVEGHTVEFLDISEQLEQETINEAALQYLASTDWMVVRAAERGEELSPEFKAARETARNSIVR